MIDCDIEATMTILYDHREVAGTQERFLWDYNARQVFHSAPESMPAIFHVEENLLSE